MLWRTKSIFFFSLYGRSKSNFCFFQYKDKSLTSDKRSEGCFTSSRFFCKLENVRCCFLNFFLEHCFRVMTFSFFNFVSFFYWSGWSSTFCKPMTLSPLYRASAMSCLNCKRGSCWFFGRPKSSLSLSCTLVNKWPLSSQEKEKKRRW